MASDLHRGTDYRTGADGRFIADLDVFAENRAGANGAVLHLGGGGNDSGGMHFAIAVGAAEQLCGSGGGGSRGPRKLDGLWKGGGGGAVSVQACAGRGACGRRAT